jgi:catechol 2,3-dioxygenase-like lactoylglutathione lyase family enzyme
MKFGCVTLDSRNAEEHADFYQKLLGWTIRFTNTDHGSKFVGIMSETKDVILLFQEDDSYVEPVWPTEQGRQQQMAHLDFFTDDVENDVKHAIACGAKPAATQYSDKWRVMIDPAGHPFCIENLS